MLEELKEKVCKANRALPKYGRIWPYLRTGHFPNTALWPSPGAMFPVLTGSRV